MQWLHDLSTLWDETTVKVYQTDELAKFTLGGRVGKGACLNVVLEGTNAITADMMSEEI